MTEPDQSFTPIFNGLFTLLVLMVIGCFIDLHSIDEHLRHIDERLAHAAPAYSTQGDLP